MVMRACPAWCRSDPVVLGLPTIGLLNSWDALQDMSTAMGVVQVTRSQYIPDVTKWSGEYIWTITFISLVGLTVGEECSCPLL